jgi:hypothetical protein
MATKPHIRPPLSISKVIYNANVFKLRNWDKRLMNAENLPQTVTRLFTMLRDRQIDHLLVGGVALLQYIEGRNTEDIDLIIASASLKKLPEIQIADRNKDFARGSFEELQIDILLTENPLFKKVQQRYATTQQFAEQTIPCATVEGLLLLKMYALPSLYRQGDFTRVGLYENDIATLIYAYRPSVEPLLNDLAHHLSSSDLREIRNILAEIRQRIDRFGPANQSPNDPAGPPPLPDL